MSQQTSGACTRLARGVIWRRFVRGAGMVSIAFMSACGGCGDEVEKPSAAVEAELDVPGNSPMSMLGDTYKDTYEAAKGAMTLEAAKERLTEIEREIAAEKEMLK